MLHGKYLELYKYFVFNHSNFRPYKDAVDCEMYCRETQLKLLEDFRKVVEKLRDVDLSALEALLTNYKEIKLEPVEPYEDPLTNFKVSRIAYSTSKEEAGSTEDE